MGRHERRASVSEFKRIAATGYLDVFLTPTDAPINNPLLERAAEYWRTGVATRRPKCIGCRAAFADGAQAGALLFVVPSVAPTSCSASAICADCWSRLSDDAVKTVALRVVRKVLPTAHFDPMDTQ
jgi:hypothetical protein